MQHFLIFSLGVFVKLQLIILPLAALLALPSSSSGVLNAPPPPPPEVSTNPPETCVPAQEVKLAEDHPLALSDQTNNVAATQGVTEQTDRSGVSATQVSKPGSAADSAEASDEHVFSVEDPVASLGLKTIISEDKPSNAFIATAELTCQEVEHVSVDAKALGGEPEATAAEKTNDHKQLAPKNVDEDRKDGLTSDLTKSSVNAAEDEILFDVASKNGNLDEAFQSKGTTKCDAPLTTCHLTGWFVFKPISIYILFII